MMKYILVVVAILVVGLGVYVYGPKEESLSPEVSPYGEVTLRVGETAYFPNLEIRILSVIEDSRGPIDAVCIWAGTLKIRLLTLSGLGEAETELELGQFMTTETEKIASEAATKRVLSQEKLPEPSMTRTICARTTIKRKVTGKDQKTMARAADFK